MSIALADDQARGLREMFARPSLQVLPVASGAAGAGKTTVVVHVALAAASLGRRVAILDATGGDIAAALGLTARWELRHLLHGLKPFADVGLQGPEGVIVVPAARGWSELARAGQPGEHLFGAFAALDPPIDLVIVNLPAGPDFEGASLLDPAGSLLLVVSPADASLTGAYAAAKRYAQQSGASRIRLVVNHVASVAEARRVHAVFAETARRYLALEPVDAGHIERDAAFAVARRARRSLFAAGSPSGSAAPFLRLAESLDGWNLARYRGATA